MRVAFGHLGIDPGHPLGALFEPMVVPPRRRSVETDLDDAAVHLGVEQVAVVAGAKQRERFDLAERGVVAGHAQRGDLVPVFPATTRFDVFLDDFVEGRRRNG